jgi:hypothetical protein
MTEQYTLTLRDIAADREWWRGNAAHYQELATWLREVAAWCRLPNPQRELLKLAVQYERQAEHADRRRSRSDVP